jgi:tripartite-type tricarboxylate transporter receptor subunit TctC
MDTLGTSKGFIDGGKVRVLGVASDKRLPQLPDVPTVQEVLGFPFAINTWYAAYAPAGTPRPIIDRLNAAFNKALKQPDLVAKSRELAIELIDDSTPRSAKKFYDDQMAFWDPIIKESGAKPE